VGFNNTFLGFEAGFSNLNGNYNVFLGNRAGYTNSSGVQNVFIGDGSGFQNSTGSQNTFIGLQAGSRNTIGGGNVFVGWNAGLFNTEGANNAFFGLGAGYSNTTSYYNTFLGFSAGLANQTGQFNTYLGANSGRSNIAGTGNLVLGESAGYSATSGDYNIIVGNTAGYNLTSGSNNVLIGSGAAFNETSISNKLYIENSAANELNSLIYGDFSTDFVRLNANVDIRNTLRFPNSGAVLWVGGTEALWFNGTYYSWGFGGGYNYFGSPVTIGNPANPGAYRLYVAGNVGVTGTVTNPSDARYKKNVSELTDVLSAIQKMRGVHYEWDTEDFPDMKFDNSLQLGFIAQEVEPVFPELVKTDNNGYKSMDYSKMTVVLFQAIKEQQKLLDSQNKRIEELEKAVSALLNMK